jgi:hypothetical protein
MDNNRDRKKNFDIQKHLEARRRECSEHYHCGYEYEKLLSDFFCSELYTSGKIRAWKPPHQAFWFAELFLMDCPQFSIGVKHRFEGKVAENKKN